MKSRIFIRIAVLFLVPLGPARADDPAGKVPQPVPSVISVASDSISSPGEVGLGDTLKVKVANLDVLLGKAKDAHGKIILYLGGLPIAGVYPQSRDVNTLSYIPARSDSNKQSWASLLGHPTQFKQQISVSVGIEGDSAISSDASISLVVIRPWWFLGALIVTVLVCLTLLLGGARSQLIRDGGPEPLAINGASVVLGNEDSEATPRPKTPLRPYSLAKTQMAFWFFLILLSFLFLWAVTGAHDTLTQSTLILMGIGAGTALGVAVQNKGKEGDSDTLKSLDSLRERRKAIVAAGGDPTPIDAQMAEIIPKSDGFFNDVLTDADGISIHRFQMFVWTAVLGVIFVKEVYSNLAMPDFNGTLLALMGISSGTFLGFMIPEAHSSDQSPPNTPTAATPDAPKPATHAAGI